MRQLLKLFSKRKKMIVMCFMAVTLQIAGTVSIPAIMSGIIDNGLVKEDIHYVLRLGVILILVAILSATASILGSYNATSLAALIDSDLRKVVFSKVILMKKSEVEKFGTATLITRSTLDITQIQDAIIMIIQTIFPVPILIIGGGIFLFMLEPIISVVLVISAILFLVVASLFIVKIYPVFIQIQEQLDKVNKVLKENIVGAKSIRIFNRSKYEVRRMRHTFGEYANKNIYANKMIAILIPIVVLITNFCMIAIIWCGGEKLRHNSMDIGNIIAGISYTVTILGYLVMALITCVMVIQARVSMKRIIEILECKNCEEETIGELSLTKIEHVAFKDVSFRYPGAEEYVLRNTSFVCKRGEKIGIIGGNGSGKTTIALLLTGFLKAQSGCIELNGENLEKFSIKDIRKHIGLVQQRPYLFSGTIGENIMYGLNELSEKEMKEAADGAAIGEFIEKLEDRYETIVGQNGKNLSGGQRQRLCLARALAEKKELYLLDDSLASVDNLTEKKILSNFEEKWKDTIFIVISQKLSTLKQMDRIIVLNNGRIVGVGAHDELYHSCNIYKQMVEYQVRQEVSVHAKHRDR